MIGANRHPIIDWFDHFIQEQETVDKTYKASEMFVGYKSFCIGRNINPPNNCNAFGIILKDCITCSLKKKKSHGLVAFEINKQTSFEWLTAKGYSQFDRLKCVFDKTSDESDEDMEIDELPKKKTIFELAFPKNK
jgi:hypothetical protein